MGRDAFPGTGDDDHKHNNNLNVGANRPHAPKQDKILHACRWRNIEELQVLAESPGGFLTDELRQQACQSQHQPFEA